MGTQRSPPTLRQNVEISSRLRCLDDTKAILPSRHGQIDRFITRDLQEHPRIRSTFVGLPR